MAKSKKRKNGSVVGAPAKSVVGLASGSILDASRNAAGPASMQPAAGGDAGRRRDFVISHYPLMAALILLIAIVLRQWNLGGAPMHPDEAIHAAGGLALGNYTYDPVYHGPLLYHLTGAVFQLAGASEFTARLVPSLMGIAIIALLVAPARGYLGERATLWAAGCLAISPVMVTYSRRLIHDSLVALLTLAAVLCFQCARENPSHTPRGRAARIGAALSLTLFVASKANAFFVIAMLLAFWFATVWSPQSESEAANELWGAPWPWWVPSLVLLTASVWAIWAVRDNQLEMHEGVLKAMSLLAMVVLWEWLRRAPWTGESRHVGNEARPTQLDLLTPLLAVALSLLCFVFLFGHGITWFQSGSAVVHGWTEAMGSPPLIGSDTAPGALRRMLTYWGGQQHNPRLPGRHDYYLVLMALYELPIVVAAIGGIVYAGRRRTPFTDLLLWWAITSCVIYALANEKVPWLLMHILLPLGLLAANWLAAVQQRSRAASRMVAVLSVVGAIYLVRGTLAANFERPADHREPMLYAQTTEEFGDAFRQSLLETRGQPGDFWVHPSKQWPLAWYLRDSKVRLGSATQWAALPASGSTLRMAVHLSPGDWQSQIDQKKLTLARFRQIRQQLAGMSSHQTSFYIWPRASWSALRPDRWARWWWDRQATLENGVLSEWSDSPVVISMRR